MSWSWEKKLVTTPQAPAVARPTFPVSNVVMPGTIAPPTKARSASVDSHCPECDSGNYWSVQGSKTKCFDCGYPLQQSGSGMIVQKAQGSTVPAKQGQGAGWNPNTYIAHI